MLSRLKNKILHWEMGKWDYISAFMPADEVVTRRRLISAVRAEPKKRAAWLRKLLHPEE